MPPIVYSTSNQSSPTVGPLPGYSGSLTWQDLNEILKEAKNLIKDDYLAYLQADLDGQATAKQAAATAMNTKLATYAASLSALGTVRFYLQNNNSVIRASSLTPPVPPPPDNVEYGRTEVIVAQTRRHTIANCIRTSGTTTRFTWYAAAAMGAFARDCEFPAHILKLALNR